MFSKSIIDSDFFLDMPLSAQCLYFHLSMRADDEGFINNSKKIQRMIGASDDDMKLLIAKKFIIVFDSGVIVIKHWKLHNYIRGDRISPTLCKEEKGMLYLTDGMYEMSDVSQTDYELLSDDKRKLAYSKSSLPYSFTYKMKNAFCGIKCPICGKIMTTSDNLLCPSIQHNIPISKGGEHEIDNISVICRSCNSSIRDNETGKLNNEDVIYIWDKIKELDGENIDWFRNPSILWDRSQLSVECQSSVSQVPAFMATAGCPSIVEVSIGEYSLGEESKVEDSKSCPKPESKAKYHPDWFDRFWALYPRKQSKRDAINAWDKLKPSLELCKIMDTALREQITWEQWQNPKYIPLPGPWLRGERWNDQNLQQKGVKKNDGFDDFRT